MGKRSIRENKNMFQRAREEAGLSRQAASEAANVVSESRIEKIESEKILPQPEDVLALSQAYKKPVLNHYYCAHYCPIGKRYETEVETKELSQIVLEVLSSLNSIGKERERLIEISVDGQISNEELKDFVRIKQQLMEIAHTANALQLWIENTILSDKIDVSALNSLLAAESETSD